MSKRLSELWNILKSLPEGHPDRPKIQKEINDIERWCMSKGLANITKLTVWDSYFDIAKFRPQYYPRYSGAVFLEDL